MASLPPKALRTFAIVARELEEAMKDQPRAHAVANQRRGPVAVAALHQHVRQQPSRLPESRPPPPSIRLSF